MKKYSEAVVKVQGKGDLKAGMKKLGFEKGKHEIKEATEKVIEKRINSFDSEKAKTI